MFAIVEFLDSDGESRGEISTVPLLWLSKKSTRCYWPYKTSGIPFPEFIKRLTPYKKSWPMYKIKLHATRDTYEAAEDVASKIISDEKENGDLTGESAISFTRKTIREASFGSSESSTDDSYIISETPKSQDGAVTREPLVLNQKHDLVLGTQTVDIENNTPSETQKPNKKTETSSGRQKIVMENNTSFVIQKTQKENKKAFTTLENNNTETDTNADTNTKPSRVNSPSNTSIGTQGIESPYIPSSSYSSISGLSGVSRNSNFEDMVLQTLAKIETNVEQNAIVIKELLQHHKLLGSNNLVRPENLPMLPIDDKEEFNTFEELLRKDKPVWDYLVRKLAAVGGSNIESFTRRIMCTLLTNKCATSFNWKGRDQKIAFSETKSVELINESICKTLPEANELTIAKSIKDWLKYAKLRISQSHARAAKKTCI